MMKSKKPVAVDLRPVMLDTTGIDVPRITGLTDEKQAEKEAFHRRARAYLKATAGAVAAAYPCTARVSTNMGGRAVGGASVLHLALADGPTLCVNVYPGYDSPNDPWRFSRADGVGTRAYVDAKYGMNHYATGMLDSVELARWLVTTLLATPLDRLTTIVAGPPRQPRLKPLPAPHQHPAPATDEKYIRLSLQLADDMANEYPDWRYGCWDDLPDAIKHRYAALASEEKHR
jgi:hypothetical protein